MENRKKRKLKSRYACDCRGFAVTTLLVLLPLLLTVGAIVAVVLLSLKAYSFSHHACRSSLLEGQRQLAVPVNKLISLNPRAKNLRAARKKAEVALKAAMATANPKAVAAAKAALAIVKERQYSLRAQQNRLLMTAKHSARLSRFKAEKTIRKSGPALVKQVQVSSFPIALYQSPFASITPDYLSKAPLESRQKAFARWQISLVVWIPKWLRSSGLLKVKPISGRCGASAQKEAGGWQAILINADK